MYENRAKQKVDLCLKISVSIKPKQKKGGKLAGPPEYYKIPVSLNPPIILLQSGITQKWMQIVPFPPQDKRKTLMLAGVSGILLSSVEPG